MTAKPIMLQGTASHVGKSLICTALCRIFHQDGYRVAPFKSQNMALNSFVTEDGGEMGRAQVTQARAAMVAPHVDMNPILLKPTGDMKSQVIVSGKAIGTMRWGEYRGLRDKLLSEAMAAYQRLADRHDIIVIEGAGSPAEVNLKDGDIVNMRIALLTGAPVFLVADIDRGGALAWIIGTLSLLPPEERALVKGVIINKFRGDVAYLQPGLDFLMEKTGVPVVGVLPYMRNLGLPDEDSVALEDAPQQVDKQMRKLQIAVVRLPTISNFTDLDAFAHEPDVHVRYVAPGEPLEPADCVIVPGSKNTLADLKTLWDAGTVDEIQAFVRRGGWVAGICGGYQILGAEVADPEHSESDLLHMAGMGLLPVKTRLSLQKQTCQVSGQACVPGAEDAGRHPVEGYEIHTGSTERLGGEPWVFIARPGSPELHGDGCVVVDRATGGVVAGTYVHSVFDAPGFRRAFLNELRRRKGWAPLADAAAGADPFDRLADVVRKNLDMQALYDAMSVRGIWP